jgi:hypothetical protein
LKLLKKSIAVFLVMILCLSTITPQNTQAAISPIDLLDAQQKANDIADAISDIGEGKVEEGVKKLAVLGIKTAADATLGTVFAVAKAAAASATIVVDSSVNYNVDNRFAEYTNKRAMEFYNARPITAEKLKAWIANGRAQFDAYWGTLMVDGPMKIKFISAVKEKRLKDEGLNSWLSTHINPFSKDAAEYNKIVNAAISSEELKEHIFEAWESAVTAQFLPAMLEEACQYEMLKLQSTFFSLRGFIVFNEKPTSGNYKVCATLSSGRDFSNDNRTLDEQTNTFRIDIPYSEFQSMKLTDKLSISIENTKTGKKRQVSTITVKELMGTPSKEDNNSYYKIINAGDLSVDLKEDNTKPQINLKAILPTGKQINLTIDNIKKFFTIDFSGLSSGGYDKATSEKSSKASVKYTDEASGKTYFAIAEVPLDNTQATITMPEPMSFPMPNTSSEFTATADTLLNTLKQNSISYEQYTNLLSSMRDSVKDSNGYMVYNTALSQAKNQAAAVLADFKAKEADFKTRFDDIQSRVYTNIYTYVGFAPYFQNALVINSYELDQPNYLFEEKLANGEKAYRELQINISKVNAIKSDFEALWSSYTLFLEDFYTRNSELLAMDSSYSYSAAPQFAYCRAYVENAVQTYQNEFDASQMDSLYNKLKANVEGYMANVRQEADLVIAKIKSVDDQSGNLTDAKINRIKGYIQSLGKEQYDKDSIAIAAFMDNCFNYYRCKLNKISGWEMWQKGFDKYRLSGFYALNRMNKYWGGQVFTEDYIQKNANNFKLIIPLLQGLKNYRSLYSVNPYAKEITQNLSSYETSAGKGKFNAVVKAYFRPDGNVESYNNYANQLIRQYAPRTYLQREFIVDMDSNAEATDIDYIISSVLSEEDKPFYKINYVEKKNLNAPAKKTENKAAVPVTKIWTIKFSSPVNKISAYYGGISVVDEKGNRVAVDIKVNQATVQVIPIVDYEHHATYTLTVSSKVKSEDDQFVLQPMSLKFTTQ